MRKILIILLFVAGCGEPAMEQSQLINMPQQKSVLAQFQETYGTIVPGFYGQPIPENFIYEEGSMFLRQYKEGSLQIIETRVWFDEGPYILKFLKLPATFNERMAKVAVDLEDPNSEVTSILVMSMFEKWKKLLRDEQDPNFLREQAYLVSAQYNKQKQELINWFSYLGNGSKVWLSDIRFDEAENIRNQDRLAAMRSTIEQMETEMMLEEQKRLQQRQIDILDEIKRNQQKIQEQLEWQKMMDFQRQSLEDFYRISKQ